MRKSPSWNLEIRGRVLGVVWNPGIDISKVRVRINISKKHKSAQTEKDLEYEEIPTILELKLTRKMLLSNINSCYDPLGLLAPITIQMKIAVHDLHGKEIE